VCLSIVLLLERRIREESYVKTRDHMVSRPTGVARGRISLKTISAIERDIPVDENKKPMCFCNLCGGVFANTASVQSLAVRGGKASLCDDCLGRAVTLAFNLGMKKVGDRVIFTAGK
jgi:hypothetical protein